MPNDTFNNLPIEKRRHIENMAINEFSTKPYEIASISNIVRKSNIAKGSFYQYFDDKKALYRYLVELGTEVKLTLLNELPGPQPDGDLFEYLRWQFLSTVHFELRYPQLARILYRAFIEDVPFPNMAEELRRRGTTQFFKQLFTQGLIHGEVAVWVDPNMAAFLTEAVFYQFGKYFINRLRLTGKDLNHTELLENEEAQHLLSNLMDILESGMKHSPELRA